MFIFRSSLGVANYAEMNDQSRRGLERFGRDVRKATDITTADEQRIVLEISTGTVTSEVEYAYDVGSRRLIRTEDGTEATILGNVSAINLLYYNILVSETSNLIEIKKVQFDAIMSKDLLQIQNTNHIISARFMIRNKKVST